MDPFTKAEIEKSPTIAGTIHMQKGACQGALALVNIAGTAKSIGKTISNGIKKNPIYGRVKR